jgi:predicted amidohydrolase YtcJ
MRATLASVLLACLMSTFVTPSSNAQKFEADLVVVNASVRTMDARQPVASAVATFGERIAAVGSAYAEFADAVKGTVTPGKLADLVILSEDIFRVDPVEIEHVRVRTTVMGGRVVYEAKE